MKNNKWEHIENQIRQYIDEYAFEKAFRLLKKSAIEKGNTLLQDEIAELKKQFDAFKKVKKRGQLPADELQNADYSLAYRLRYFIECLQKGGAVKATQSAKPPINTDDGSATAEAMPSKSGSAEAEKSESMSERSEPIPISAATTLPKPKKSSTKPPVKQQPKTSTEGGILYNIPDKMQLGVQTRCIVRLAFDKTQLKREIGRAHV